MRRYDILHRMIFTASQSGLVRKRVNIHSSNLNLVRDAELHCKTAKLQNAYFILAHYGRSVAIPTDDNFDSILHDAAHGILKPDTTIVRPDPINKLFDLDQFMDYQSMSFYLIILGSHFPHLIANYCQTFMIRSLQTKI